MLTFRLAWSCAGVGMKSQSLWVHMWLSWGHPLLMALAVFLPLIPGFLSPGRMATIEISYLGLSIRKASLKSVLSVNFCIVNFLSSPVSECVFTSILLQSKHVTKYILHSDIPVQEALLHSIFPLSWSMWCQFNYCSFISCLFFLSSWQHMEFLLCFWCSCNLW